MLFFGIFWCFFFNKVITFDLFNSIQLAISNQHSLKKYSINFTLTNLPTNSELINYLHKLNQNTALILQIIDNTDKKCTEAEHVIQNNNDNEKELNLPELKEYRSRMSIINEKISQYLSNNEDFDRVVRGAIFEYKQAILERKRRIEILLSQKLGSELRIQHYDFANASSNIGEFLLLTKIPIHGIHFYSYAQLYYISQELGTLIECADHAHQLCEASMFTYDSNDCFNFIRTSVSFKHFYDWSLDAIRLDSQLNNNTNLTFDLENNEGAPGFDGFTGETGDAGEAGDDIFEKGIKGQQGIKGDMGEVGEQGESGDKGYVSDDILYNHQNWYGGRETECPAFIKYSGPRGLQGEDGEMGAKGISGEKGEVGNKGEPGESSNETIIRVIEHGDDGERGDDIDCVHEMLQDSASTIKNYKSEVSNDPNNILNPIWWSDNAKHQLRMRVTLNNKMATLKKILTNFALDQ